MISVDDVLDRLAPPAAITADNLVTVVRTVMEAVEGCAGATGAEKKAAVLECLRALVRQAGALGDAEEATLALLPHLIDELVVVSKDGLRINQRHRRLSLRCLGSFLRRLCCLVVRK